MGNEPDNLIRQLSTLDLSKLHRYSFGIVIEDNLDNEFKIKVYPVEKLFNLGSDLNKEDKWKEKKIKERKVAKTEEYDPKYLPSLEDIEIDRTRYIYANWIKSNNQITPPNVCKGEYVTLYRYSNKDEYYWDVELSDLTLRKEEHVVYTFSDKPNLDKTEDPIEDRYTVTFSPKNKEVKIHTTNKYGEYTTYDITIKTDDGYIEIIDGMNNSIKLDSTQDMLHTHIEGTAAKYDETIHGDQGYIETKDDKGNKIKLDSTQDMLHTHIEGTAAKYDETIHGDKGYIETKDDKGNKIKLDSNAGSLTTNINKNVDVTTPTVNFNCSSFNVNTNSANIKASSTKFTGGTIKHDGASIDKQHTHIGNLGVDTSAANN